MSGMKVFISYAAADMALAKQIGAGLKASGLQVWDPSDVFPGENWGTKLGEALESADAMVVLLTPNSVEAPNVTMEVGFALGNKEYKGRIVPVLAAPPEELPRETVPWILYRFNPLQFTQASADKDIQNLSQTLKAVMEGESLSNGLTH